jgi:hypothetical protein
VLIAARGMAHQTGGLVDDEQVVVFGDDGELGVVSFRGRTNAPT